MEAADYLDSNDVSNNHKSDYCLLQTTWEQYGEKHTKYDWWQATISIEGMGTYREKLDSEGYESEPDIEAFLNWLSNNLPMATKRLGAGRNGYERSVSFVIGDTVECLVQWGGVNPDPNITATGHNSPAIHALITSKFPDGKISRIDSAFDSMSGTKSFKTAAIWLEGRATEAGMNYRWIRNSDPSIGDTLYVGSPNSRVMIRLYEKGKQMGYKIDDWWRAEVQLKPSSRDKQSAYSYSPGMVWAASRVTRDFLKYLTGESLAAVGFQGKLPDKTLDTKAGYLLKQYHNTIRELLEESGGAEALVLRLDRIAAEMGLPRLSQREVGESL